MRKFTLLTVLFLVSIPATASAHGLTKYQAGVALGHHIPTILREQNATAAHVAECFHNPPEIECRVMVTWANGIDGLTMNGERVPFVEGDLMYSLIGKSCHRVSIMADPNVVPVVTRDDCPKRKAPATH